MMELKIVNTTLTSTIKLLCSYSLHCFTQPTRTQLGDPGSDPFSEQEITGSPLSAEEREIATQVIKFR